MDSSDTQSPHSLTDEQIAILVAVVLEEFGAGLTRMQFNEVMITPTSSYYGVFGCSVTVAR